MEESATLDKKPKKGFLQGVFNWFSNLRKKPAGLFLGAIIGCAIISHPFLFATGFEPLSHFAADWLSSSWVGEAVNMSEWGDTVAGWFGIDLSQYAHADHGIYADAFSDPHAGHNHHDPFAGASPAPGPSAGWGG